MINFNKKRYGIFLIISTMFLVVSEIYYFYTAYDRFMLKRLDTIGQFYEIQNGTSFLIIFFYFVILPFVYSYQMINAKNNGFDKFITTRIKSKSKYFKKVFLTNAVYVGLTQFIYELAQLITARIIFGSVDWQSERLILKNSFPFIFSRNPLTNATMYIFLSIVGTVIFSTFIMVIGLFIKNNTIYLGSGLIISLTCVLIPGFINSTLNLKSSLITWSIFLMSLITPGQGQIGAYAPTFNAYIPFAGAALFYGILSIVLFLVWKYKFMED